MSSSRRSPLLATSWRRPAGPRCHGGASSLLRLGSSAVPQRVATARASGWSELADADAVAIEHIVGLPVRAARAATALSS